MNVNANQDDAEKKDYKVTELMETLDVRVIIITT